jgi:flagellar basal-body rod protein FlgB
MTVAPIAAAGASPLYVMDLAARRAAWSGVRQAAIAGNIANANTPGYKARDIEPFVADVAKTRLQLATTAQGHMPLSATELSLGGVGRADGWDMTHSGNDVSLDEQLAKADETGRQHELSVSVMAAFHRMILASVSFR